MLYADSELRSLALTRRLLHESRLDGFGKGWAVDGHVGCEPPNDPPVAADQEFLEVPHDVGRFLGQQAVLAISADSFARAVAFAISQPDDMDVNEILFRPTRQVY